MSLSNTATDAAFNPSPSSASVATRGDIQTWPVRSTAEGGTYFRVWITNLLLTLVTLGLFTPWARRRNARYFYSTTWVGDSPLEFTAEVRGMVTGYLLMLVVFVALAIGEKIGSIWLVMGVYSVFMLAWPYLWGSSMRFRLRNTYWHGLTMHFSASTGKVYRAHWSFLIVMVLIGFAVFSVTVTVAQLEDFGTPYAEQTGDSPPEYDTAANVLYAEAEEARPIEELVLNDLALDEGDDGQGADASAHNATIETAADDDNSADAGTEEGAESSLFHDDSENEAEADSHTSSPDALSSALLRALLLVSFVPKVILLAGALAILGVVAVIVLSVRYLYDRDKVLYSNMRVGTEPTQWTTQFSQYLHIWVLLFGVVILSLGGLLLLYVVLVFIALFSSMAAHLFAVAAILPLVLLYFGLLPGLGGAYRAMLFKARWGGLGVSQFARFRTNLSTWAFVRLSIVNWFLTLLTIGFYRPFARVKEVRMLAGSLSLYVLGDLRTLTDRAEAQPNALGDAVMDVAGIDFLG